MVELAQNNILQLELAPVVPAKVDVTALPPAFHEFLRLRNKSKNNHGQGT